MVVRKRISVLAAFFLASLTMCAASLSAAEQTSQKRMALVMGNDRYQFLSDLKNPQFDANAISQTLSSLDFTVYLAHNLTQSETQRAVNYFNARAQDADVALVYFAGHGARVAGSNYLFGTDFNPAAEFDPQSAISFHELQEELSKGLRSNIFLIDACQDDPFLSADTTTRLIEAKQLIPQNPSLGSIVTFASTAGSAAYDGTHAHSIFTGALLDNLQTQGIDLEAMLRNVRRDVIVTTGSQQVPQTLSTLVAQIQLNSGKPSSTPATSRTQVLSLAETGVQRKPVLLDMAAGLRPKFAAQTERGQRQALKQSICAALKGASISQCLTRNLDHGPPDMQNQIMSFSAPE